MQGFWLKNLIKFHECIANQTNEKTDDRMTYTWKNVSVIKKFKKGTADENFRSIYSCVDWVDFRILFLEKRRLLPEENKGCQNGSRKRKDQLSINKAILRDYKRRNANLAVCWVDDRNT